MLFYICFETLETLLTSANEERIIHLDNESQGDLKHKIYSAGKSTEVQRAVTAVEGGVLFVDLSNSSAVGECVLQALVGGSRGFLSRLRDSVAGV